MDVFLSKLCFFYLEAYSCIKAVLVHSNTPAYIQAFTVMAAALVGSNFLKKKTAERRFDLVVKAYKLCLVAIAVLQRVKQPPVIFQTRKEVDVSISNSKELFLKSAAFFAEKYQDTLKEEHQAFEDLYECYSEMRLFFHGRDEAFKSIENLLYVRNRLMDLLENMKLCHELIKGLMPEYQDQPVKTAVNAMVQIWENIELDEEQKQAQDRVEEVDGLKGIRKFRYLNDMINQARTDIDKVFPKLINSNKLDK